MRLLTLVQSEELINTMIEKCDSFDDFHHVARLKGLVHHLFILNRRSNSGSSYIVDRRGGNFVGPAFGLDRWGNANIVGPLLLDRKGNIRFTDGSTGGNIMKHLLYLTSHTMNIFDPGVPTTNDQRKVFAHILQLDPDPSLFGFGKRPVHFADIDASFHHFYSSV